MARGLVRTLRAAAAGALVVTALLVGAGAAETPASQPTLGPTASPAVATDSPAPTDTPTPTGTATTSAPPAPADTGTPTPPPTTVPPTTPSPTLSTTPPPPVAPHAATVVTGQAGLTASDVVATDLVYVGSGDVDGVTVLRFTASSLSLSGTTSLVQPCTGGVQLGWEPRDVTAAAVTLDVTELEATVGGTFVSFTPGSPPTTAFPSPVELTGVSASLVTMSATQLQTGSLRTVASPC